MVIKKDNNECFIKLLPHYGYDLDKLENIKVRVSRHHRLPVARVKFSFKNTETDKEDSFTVQVVENDMTFIKKGISDGYAKEIVAATRQSDSITPLLPVFFKKVINPEITIPGVEKYKTVGLGEEYKSSMFLTYDDINVVSKQFSKMIRLTKKLGDIVKPVLTVELPKELKEGGFKFDHDLAYSFSFNEANEMQLCVDKIPLINPKEGYVLQHTPFDETEFKDSVCLNSIKDEIAKISDGYLAFRNTEKDKKILRDEYHRFFNKAIKEKLNGVHDYAYRAEAEDVSEIVDVEVNKILDLVSSKGKDVRLDLRSLNIWNWDGDEPVNLGTEDIQALFETYSATMGDLVYNKLGKIPSAYIAAHDYGTTIVERDDQEKEEVEVE